MLEEHETLLASRDSRFRSLVKEFKTVSEADFEEPKSISRVLRNYQKEGYRWLRVLADNCFGGILADLSLIHISASVPVKEEVGMQYWKNHRESYPLSFSPLAASP